MLQQFQVPKEVLRVLRKSGVKLLSLPQNLRSGSHLLWLWLLLGVRERYAMIDRCFENAANSPVVGKVDSFILNSDVFN